MSGQKATVEVDPEVYMRALNLVLQQLDGKTDDDVKDELIGLHRLAMARHPGQFREALAETTMAFSLVRRDLKAWSVL